MIRKKVDASFWEVGQPNGGEGENCVRTYVGQSHRYTQTAHNLSRDSC